MERCWNETDTEVSALGGLGPRLRHGVVKLCGWNDFNTVFRYRAKVVSLMRFVGAGLLANPLLAVKASVGVRPIRPQAGYYGHLQDRA